MAKKSKDAKDLCRHIQDILETDPSRALNDFIGIVDKLGALPSAITKEEQNQLKIKPSKESKAVFNLQNDEKVKGALLKQLDEASIGSSATSLLRFLGKLSTVPQFAEQLGRSEIAPCFLRFGERLLMQKPASREEQAYARSVELEYAFLIGCLLDHSPDFREATRHAGLFQCFLAVFRRKWESDWPAVRQADFEMLLDVAFSIQQAVFAVQKFAADPPQDLGGVAFGGWLADLIRFMDKTWDRLIAGPAPPGNTRPLILELLIDSFGRLLKIVVGHDLKTLSGIETNKGFFCRVLDSKAIPYLESKPILSPFLAPDVAGKVENLRTIVAYLKDGKGEGTERRPSSRVATDSIDLTQALALLRAGKWQKARAVLETSVAHLKGCTATQAEALAAAGFVRTVLELLRMTVPENSERPFGSAGKDMDAVVEAALHLLLAVIHELDSAEPSRDLFFTTALQLLQWSADLRAQGGTLTDSACNNLLGMLAFLRVERERKLPERMQIAYVDLAVFALNNNPQTDTAGVAWGALASLKTFALNFGDRSPWSAAHRVDDEGEYLWRPSSDAEPPDTAGSDSVALWNVSKVFNHPNRRVCLLALQRLHHVARSDDTWFEEGTALSLIAVLEACCRDQLQVQLTVLPRIESVVHSLTLVHASLATAFGPLRDGDAPPDLSHLTAAQRKGMFDVLEEAHDDLASVLCAVLHAMTHPVGDERNKVMLRKKTLLEAARAGAAAECASVLRDLRAIRAVAPIEAASNTWVELEGAVRGLWEELALEYNLRACSNTACQGKLVEESKHTFRTCARCRLAHYCSKDCQVKHWASGHRRQCSTSSA